MNKEVLFSFGSLLASFPLTESDAQVVEQTFNQARLLDEASA